MLFEAGQYKKQISIVAGVVLATMLFSCKNDIETVDGITRQDTMPVQVVNDVEVLYSEEALLKARLLAPTMYYYTHEKPYTLMPDGIEVFFYDSLKMVDSHLKSNYAVRFEDEQIVEAKNNVVITNSKGEVLYTEHLIWDEKRERIYTEEPVKITTAEEVLFGEGLESDQYFTNYEIKKPAGEFAVEQE